MLKRTTLFSEHIALGARIVDFGGWEMPVQYSGVVDEHKAVRNHVGLFDVSHMGEVMVAGRGALDFLQQLTTNDLSRITIGQAQYSALCYDNGTLVDDIIIYRRGYDSFFICVNASNAEKDFAWMQEHLPKAGVILENLSSEYAQIAVQGPRARELVQEIVDIKIAELKYYHFAEGKCLGAPSIIARTGYTGEQGYELYLPVSAGAKVWQGLLNAGEKFGAKPIGLGARDTLRLEMGYLLYGNDMDQTTTALECGLSWITKFEKGDFIGRAALVTEKETGSIRKLVGFEMIDRAIARHGYPVYSSENSPSPCGSVTSGSPSPSTGKNLGMVYLPKEKSALESKFWVDVRGVRKLAQVAKKPFYVHGSAQG